MQGFHPKSKAKNCADGGMVRGPGTGVSDDVKAKVRTGSFVMPADTTRALGFKPEMRDVNLSNGENVVTPEKVAAIGAAVLNLVKGATHTPAAMQENEPGEGPEHEGAETPMYEMTEDAEEKNQARGFFADGGMVEEEKKRRFINPLPNTTSAIKMAADDVGAAYRQGGVGAALGQATRSYYTPMMGALDDVGKGVSTVLDVPAQALKTAVTGDATPIGQEPAVVQRQAVPTEVASAAAPKAIQQASAMPAQPDTPAAKTPPKPTMQTQQAKGFMPGIYQHGRGQYSDNPEGMGFPAGFTGKPNAQNDSAAQALADRSMQGANSAVSSAQTQVQPGQGLYIAPDTGGFGLLDKNRLRERELRMATTSTKSGMESQQAYESRIKGAVGALQGFQAEQAAAPRYEAEQAIRGREMDLRGQEVAQRGEDMRQARGFRAGQLANDQARTALDAKRVNSEVEARGFEVNQAKRLENLRARYEAATDPKMKAELAQQLRTLSGKDEQANRFTVVPGGQEYDPQAMVMRNVPARVLNNQTGQFVDGIGARSLPPIKDNADAMAIVNDQSMSKEERAAKLREMGYN